MKKLILIAALLAFNANAEESKKERLCKTIYEVADSVMKSRQNGTPMEKLMGITNGNKELIDMVIGAYRMPLMNSHKMKMQMRTEYANKKMVECYQS